MFSYLSKSRGISYVEAIREMGQNVNAPLSTYLTREDQARRIESLRQADEITRQEKESIKLKKSEAVEALYKRSTPIEGTVVSQYLRDERKLTTSLPEDLRVLRGTPDSPLEFDYVGQQGKPYKAKLRHTALAAFARDSDGNLQAVQLTKLGEDGTRAISDSGEKLPKLKYGTGNAAFATIQSDPGSQTVIIAEGVETALSIKESGIRATIVASQGIQNIMHYEGSEKHIILASDNDDHKANSGTHKVIARAEEHYSSQGKEVTIIKPQTAGHDFNDVLKEKGVDGIKDYLKNIGIQMDSKENALVEERNTLQHLSFKEKARLIREERTGRSSQNDKGAGIEWD